MDLETERLHLRSFAPDDAGFVLDVLGRTDVVRWLDDGEPQLMRDLDAARAKIAFWRELEAPLHQWAIEVRATGGVVGWVCLVLVPDAGGLVQVGWTLHPDAHGHGYATEAAQAAIDHGLAAGLDEIRVLMMVDNEASLRVAQRLGLRDLGTTHQWYESPSRMFLATPPRD
ncbi:GNAT family N-acetyltransferase [Nocardioides psychrotolerans]|uniref:Protein N-acetyltransferase, RimJ/RimL family n=1 Tax=Nocardioides psychrotolerans TaxID=1005945 RepID=A0A1I3CPA9_9ACTN|nr:GNAT family N-acetyltransferase [Nocardioides psychrotolerans]SFH76166.1 Protein N-acetyltransferase, RimJ/RimL family [Nocardioides psychrotolerans]